MIEVKKAKNDTFKCKYEKSFKLPNSLRRHARTCKNKLIDLEQIERESELIDINDSDISELLNLNDKIISVDCFDAIISHEKC